MKGGFRGKCPEGYGREEDLKEAKGKDLAMVCMDI